MYEKYDIAIIGSGPGGYNAALYAAAKGCRVALIEKEKIGGICLHKGCIPTKSLLASSHAYAHVKNFRELGINIDNATIDFSKIMHRKDTIVDSLSSSLESLIKQRKIDIIVGTADIANQSTVTITSGGHRSKIEADNIILATGSRPYYLDSVPTNNMTIFNSDSILNLQSLPSSITIIGGGYIGCEFASFFQELDVKVTIIEMASHIGVGQGKLAQKMLHDSFVEKGVTILTGEKVVASQDNGQNGVTVSLESGKNIDSDIVLVAVGRSPVVPEGLSNVGVAQNPNGTICVTKEMRTTINNIFAIGDITPSHQLAHVATHEAIVAVKNILGNQTDISYEAVPSVVFTSPEIATVGSHPDVAELDSNLATTTYTMQSLGSTRAKGNHGSGRGGIMQVTYNKNTLAITGACCVGDDANLLIAEMTLAIQNELTLECVAETIHAHPTTSEGWLESTFLSLGTPLHALYKKKS